jgi:hypothetical protein
MPTSTDFEPTTPASERDQLALRRFRDRLLAGVHIADLMALLMVAATAFSAYATWETAAIANAIYQASERAYFGIAKTSLDDSRPTDPRVSIDYRNLGNVSATDLKILRRLFINGVEVKSSTRVTRPGILSPGPPHLFYLQIPPAAYDPIATGKSALVVQVAATYTNPWREPLCYMVDLTYNLEEQDFDVKTGSLDCAAQNGLWPAS